MELESERKRHAQIVVLEKFVARLEEELGSGSWRQVAAGGGIPVVPGRLLRLQALLLARSALKSRRDLAMIIAACNSMDLKGALADREAGRAERRAVSAAAGASARTTKQRPGMRAVMEFMAAKIEGGTSVREAANAAARQNLGTSGEANRRAYIRRHPKKARVED